ncbi:hypothetical protein [Pseudoxanthomonas sp. JBR18]|uniref:hypothetical protein n=1 Tax=Pseudoxanthomonas sp. JBR18 TaxID=2969308 RepID=UPI002306C839|nr:hypothetical protein [Pseudoxanthomonas sp. JBR18]WCE04221.1 hypothetical protein PJ250_19475 [Pseudoxanthomonas sp. JBR18]
MRTTLICTLAAASAFSASQAAPAASVDTDEANWLYFPMYARDTAHAVDLSALHWREDGLLASASRYPRHDHDHWPDQADKAAWYEYETKLIDCRTGHFVPVQQRLLDREGHVLARRDVQPGTQADRLAEQIERGDGKLWPERSETFLACAAAADASLRERRRALAATTPPALSFVPIQRVLQRDTDTLFEREEYRFDPETLKTVPTTPDAIYRAALEGYARWRRQVMGKADVPAPHWDAATRQRIEQALEPWAQAHFAPIAGTLQIESDASLRFETPAPFLTLDEQDLPADLPEQARRDASLHEQIHLDCRSGIAMPQAIVWRSRARDAQVLYRMPVPAQALLQAIRSNRQEVHRQAWGLRRGAYQAGADRNPALCLVAWHAARSTLRQDTEAARVWPRLALPDRTALIDAGAPAAMLLRARHAWQEARP